MKKTLILIFMIFLISGCSNELSEPVSDEVIFKQYTNELQSHYYSTKIYQYEKIIESIISNKGVSEDFTKGMAETYRMENNLYYPVRFRDKVKILSDNDFNNIYNLYKNMTEHTNKIAIEGTNNSSDNIEKLKEIVKLTDQIRGLNPYKETNQTTEKVKELNEILENIVNE
ncbi:outer membrane protein assembly factor BamD [Chengkuizengella marina]|uniref:Lipoprotein n=1 Tax=Chengkuizengella marina TaxID=2507566 RepID=A0A6N9Q019_9BACL|nr:hypothetical protein [Chengkuizengella marina]NBI28205.1 hypothetical protein [Chengkuizengella marina]